MRAGCRPRSSYPPQWRRPSTTVSSRLAAARGVWTRRGTGGQTQGVVERRIECEQEGVWIKVEEIAGACHTGRRSCFYRAVPLGKAGAVTLEFRDERVFDPKTAYRTKD